ncbi:MAG: hypothetical protein VXW87_04110 [Pseudomonadota bacterium]|nr:hypothetical protein [Pseudomonadota bacterium]
MNRILFQHIDGTIYLTIEKKLITLYKTCSKYRISEILKKLDTSQKKKLSNLISRQLKTE